MVSVIDMPPPDESTWWRGKKGYEVGFFPSECVEVIGDKVPHSFKLSSRASTKPVFRKHGKVIAFFRSFLLSRPSRRKLKQSGILKERVFGCDLGEHLLNTGREIPLVLKCCTEFIEEYGVVDGIYRLSGVNSNIQRLRLAFDEDRATNLGDPSVVQDVHSVASLLKMYFRELPNPLLTYQLYDKFVSAVQSEEDVRLLRIRDVVQQLPPPHYRTLQFLLDHLARIASHGSQTGMTPKNIAIVWAPNLLRSREVENGGVGALHVVGVQAVLTEYLVRYADLIFDEKMSVCQSGSQDESTCLRARPKSLAISTPTKLLSLEEARARALSTHLPLTQQKYIEVGGGPEKLPSKYHTVIDLPSGKHSCPKLKKSPSGWKSFFSRGWYSGSARDKSRPSRNSRKASTASLPHTSMHIQEKSRGDIEMSYNYPKKLRTVKSAESLVHCLKEAGPILNEDDKSRNSPKTPQQVSMDSPYCFVDTPCSAFPRSPSLQRHTRSSSHESYFENSMDMASDPSVEDDSSLYYFVKEQMQKLQQQQTESSLWTTTDNSKNKEPEEMMNNYPKYLDNNESSVVESDLPPVKDNYDVEKIIRKQKFCAIDGDPALAKVQRLSWMNSEGSSSKAYAQSPNEEPKPMFSPDFSYTSKNVGDQNAYVFVPESDSVDYSSSSVLGENVPWLKATSLHSTKLDGKPDICPSLCDDSLEKRYSCISSSDNEAETGSKIVVERYGNAETVLVEVHATQDTSSESESDFDEGCNQMRKDFGVCGNLGEPVGHNFSEETTDKSKLKRYASGDNWKESFQESLSSAPCSTMIPSEDESHFLPGTTDYVYHSSPDRTDDMLHSPSERIDDVASPSSCDDGLDSELTMDSVQNNELTKEEKGSFADVDSVKDFSSHSLSDSLPPCEDLNNTIGSCLENHAAVLSAGSEGIISVSELSVDDSALSPNSVGSLEVHQDRSELEGASQENASDESKDGENLLRLRNEKCPKKYMLDDDDEMLSRQTEIMTSHSVIDAPSLTSLPVQSSTSEVHSLRTKIENIPLHRKRQILHIPTPSSPVEEVRKKFELRATCQKKNVSLEHPPADSSLQSNVKEFPTKLDRRHTEVFEVQHSTADTLESIKRKSDGILSAKAEALPNKRHSEPFSASPKVNAGNVISCLSPCSQPTSHSQKVSESKSTSDSSSTRSKPSLPSLFTQLKVRKLQSLQGESPTQAVDPWSDPILDMQEEYHPVVRFPELAKIGDLSVSEMQPESSEDSSIVNSPLSHLSLNDGVSDTAPEPECSEMIDSGDAFTGLSSKNQESEIVQAKNHQLQDLSEESNTVSSESPDRNKGASETETKALIPKDVPEDEAVRRERINRIKEERRAQLREQLLKSESLRLEPEEKEKIQTKFRFRKDYSRQTVAACTFDSSEYLPGELKDILKSANLSEGDKSALASDDKVDQVIELSRGSETESSEYTSTPTPTLLPTSDKTAKLCAGYKGTEDSSVHQPSIGDSVSVPKKLVKSEAFGTSSCADLNSSTKRVPGSTVPQPLSSVRESKFTSLTDVRDRVAMFERSKDKESCRAGPNGKFPQKQSASTLTSSYVR